MTIEIAPRRTQRVFCPIEGRNVEHVIVTLDSGLIRWCQSCFCVLDLTEWERHCGAAKKAKGED